MNDQPIKKQTFLQGTAVLAMATVLVKLMGFLFKVPLNNIIGEDGFGYFNTAYDVYNVLLMISTTGLPVAMSRMISQAQTLGNHAQIKLGMDADLILLDFTQPHLIPCHNVLSNLVYAASGHDVVLTMVRGQILYNAGKFPTLDLAGALKELHDYAIPKVFSDDEEAPK